MIPNQSNFKFTKTALSLLMYSSLLLFFSSAHAKHILVYGDSLSAAYGMELEQGWVSLLGEKWTGDHTITNASISGETTHGGLQRLPVTLDRVKPDIVLIELGANDGLRGAPIKQIRSNLMEMVKLSKAAGTEVVVAGISIPATYGPRYIDQFRAVFKEVADAKEVNYIDLYQEDFVTQEGYIQADGLHPTAITQPLMRDIVAEYFSQQELLETSN